MVSINWILYFQEFLIQMRIFRINSQSTNPLSIGISHFVMNFFFAQQCVSCMHTIFAPKISYSDSGSNYPGHDAWGHIGGGTVMENTYHGC